MRISVAKISISSACSIFLLSSATATPSSVWALSSVIILGGGERGGDSAQRAKVEEIQHDVPQVNLAVNCILPALLSTAHHHFFPIFFNLTTLCFLYSKTEAIFFLFEERQGPSDYIGTKKNSVNFCIHPTGPIIPLLFFFPNGLKPGMCASPTPQNKLHHKIIIVAHPRHTPQQTKALEDCSPWKNIRTSSPPPLAFLLQNCSPPGPPRHVLTTDDRHGSLCFARHNTTT